MSRDTEPQVSPTQVPRSITFWGHIVGIAIVLLALPPRLYAHESFLYFFGQWVGSLVIIYGTAAVITGLGYLFFTAKLKPRVWRWFVSCAWTIAALLLFGHWVVVPAADNLAKSAEKPTQLNSQKYPEHPDWSAFLTREEYLKRKERADVICRQGSLIDLDCLDAVLDGKK